MSGVKKKEMEPALAMLDEDDDFEEFEGIGEHPF